MSAGRDVERLIAGWLEEDAAARAPDRVLDAARQSIRRTGQRRIVVAWREPMHVTPLRLAGVAAGFAAAIIAAAWIGRITAPLGVGSAPSPTPVPTAVASAEVSIDEYRAARTEICTRYGGQTAPFKAQLDGLYDPTLSDTARMPKIAALSQIVSLGDQANAEIEAIPAPASLAVDVALANDRARQQGVLLHGELDRLAAGDLAGAESLDKATDPLARQIEEFLQQYRLDACL